MLLKELYKDFCDMYDTLVDRSALTTRKADVPTMDGDAETNDLNETIQHAIRRVESEYDRATPPVMPPIPFDTPLIPQFSHSFNRDHVIVSDQSALQAKRLSQNEVNEVLLGSYNRESINASPFIQDFFNYERRMGDGKTLEQIVDARCGQWLFMYAVLQALPMTVVDARDLQYTEGAEYFLCVPPRGGRPWMKEDQSTSRAWYNVASGGGVVSMPADQIDHGVEGVYRRSHCWNVATDWANALPDAGLAPFKSVDTMSLQPPPSFGTNSPYLNPQQSPYGSPQLSPVFRPLTPTSSNDHHSLGKVRSSVSLGLEAMNTPPPQHAQRPVSSFNPNITFDAILGERPRYKARAKRGRNKKKLITKLEGKCVLDLAMEEESSRLFA